MMCVRSAGSAHTHSGLTEACGIGGASAEASGLLPGLTMQNILWAMMAQPQSHQVLLDACMRLVLLQQSISADTAFCSSRRVMHLEAVHEDFEFLQVEVAQPLPKVIYTSVRRCLLTRLSR